MKFIKNLGQKLNSTQKTIVSIAVPLALFVITFAIAEDAGYKGAFDMDDTWLIWLIFVGIAGYFEFHLYSDNKK
ncbi:hypothetical protein [Pleomorphovibrio marinus]|uniref:hypothetical protein n=1 Tax=Pleomorphovibrio marinus TaxID=2164132 RepID=UPI000E0C390E|nr:hypothetical protein [Pleomorphovibrio marinus]